MNYSTKTISSLLVVGAAFAALPVSAALIAYEGFDSTVGEDALASSAGATSLGFSGNWSASPANDVIVGLTYGTLQTVGGAAQIDDNSFGAGSLRSFSASQSGTIWVSVVFQSSLTPSGFAGLTLVESGNDNGALALGHAFGASQVGMWGEKITAFSTTVSASNVNFLVAELNLSAGTGTFYVNPTGLGSGSAPLSADATTSISFSAFTTVGIGLRGNSSASFDEVRVGTTWADVSPTASAIPEPSAYSAVLGAVFLGFAVSRRRKSV